MRNRRFMLLLGIVALMLIPIWSSHQQARQERIAAPSPLPTESFSRPPEEPFDKSDYVIKIRQMRSFYDVPGEFGYTVRGENYGFESLSFILTETHPNGGPPLHSHTVEEAHVVLSGTVSYIIGDRRFTADGPYVARVPARVPHTFINSGPEPFNLIAVFPSKRMDYSEVGPNPLVKHVP